MTERGLRLLLPAVALMALAGCGREQAANEPVPAVDSGVEALEVTTLAEGRGQAVEPGQVAVVHYSGWLYDPAAPENKGRQFDSSRPRGQPFAFPLGAGRVIPGWDQGVSGMQVGETRRLVVPPELAYGERGAGGVIPPGATLVFDVELLRID
jgi:FKBP-type peptidyl-prolyl cis-trans isomerase